MALKVQSVSQTVEETVEVCRTFDDSRPQFIPTGIAPLDAKIGGMTEGQCGVLGMCQGVGKSSTILVSAFGSSVPVGVISLEDTPDVVGTRVLAMFSGVNSLKIRLKDMTAAETRKVKEAQEMLREREDVQFAYPIGGSMVDIVSSVKQLADRGCKLVWLDYIQKVRGIRDDRHNEVATAYTRFQRECFNSGMACMVASQFSRMVDRTDVPRMHHLKETGDLENEARLIVLGYLDDQNDSLVRYVVPKVSWGLSGFSFLYRRDSSGTLRAVNGGDYAK